MLHKLQLSELKALVAFTQILTSPSYQKSSNWQRTAIPTRSLGSVSSGERVISQAIVDTCSILQLTDLFCDITL